MGFCAVPGGSPGTPARAQRRAEGSELLAASLVRCQGFSCSGTKPWVRGPGSRHMAPSSSGEPVGTWPSPGFASLRDRHQPPAGALGSLCGLLCLWEAAILNIEDSRGGEALRAAECSIMVRPAWRPGVSPRGVEARGDLTVAWLHGRGRALEKRCDIPSERWEDARKRTREGHGAS